jgi:hypothetical protein
MGSVSSNILIIIYIKGCNNDNIKVYYDLRIKNYF